MQDFQVLFCSSRQSVDREERTNQVFVWPINHTWNDFGYGFSAEALISIENGSDLLLSLCVIPRDEGNSSRRFDSWLAELNLSGESLLTMDLGPRFFSILHSESEYHKLVSWLRTEGVEPAAVLRPLRDIVFLRQNLIEHDSLEVFLNSNAARNGVFRRELTYLAWHRAGRILSSIPNDEIEDARKNFSFEIRLNGFNGPHILDVRFESPAPLSDRCHAIIGKNGLGKSQFLRELVLALGRRIDATETDPFRSNSNSRGVSEGVLSSTFRVNRVIVLSWDNQSNFPSEARLNSRFQYLHFKMCDVENELQDRASLDRSEGLAEQLFQLLREHIARISERFDRLRKSLKPQLDLLDIAIAITPNTGETVPYWISLKQVIASNEKRQLEIFSKLEGGLGLKKLADNGDAVELSSGERVFLGFGIRCVARMEKGTLLILDEPETHLHPNLISELMRVLNVTLQSTNSIALIATHSPFIVRELPSRCVHVIRLDEELAPIITSAYLRTFGASVDRLAADIFDDASTTQVNLEIAEEISKIELDFEEKKSLYGKELSPELLSEIRELMRTQEK